MTRHDGRWRMPHTSAATRMSRSSDWRAQNSHVMNWPAKSARPPPNTIPEICRLAPPSANINMRPPITIATRASDRASGPVNVSARLFAARSHGDWARTIAGTVMTMANTMATPWATGGQNLPVIGTSTTPFLWVLSYKHSYDGEHWTDL